MDFTKQKQVDDYINSLGVFLDNDELYMKTGKEDFILIDSKKQRILDYVDKNTSPFVDLTVRFPVINLKIFTDYEKREKEIEKNSEIFNEIKDSKKYAKKGWVLIGLGKSYPTQEFGRVKYLIYDYNNRDFNPIKDDFLEEKDIKNSYSISNIAKLKKINSDTFENQYKKAYEIEMKKWNEIPIYDIGDFE